ncbi:hypothetical protein MKQ70_08475 [Chitinophaga sedimenti]|uniref:hypothetical protein n=1 Tax=Chitinophaga sedimenti TaxID=2033606 RepID=UPI002005B795|nr:hypothetical protein [Chitinophaga sedimenti]MCK7555041.1 hypothetical protein [Chitinophaga sedimenti]
MLFNFPQNGEVTVTTHHHPHTFVDLITHADVMETTGTFGAIQQQTDAGGRSQVAFYHFRLKSAVEAYFDLEEPGVFLNYVVTGRIDAHHDQLGDMWQQHHTCSLSYLPTGKHCYRIQKGNCISVKVKISLPLIEMLSKSYPDLHTFYKRASTLSPDGWRLPYVPTGSKTTKLLRQLASWTNRRTPRSIGRQPG